ncbi:MAG: T9SS type A sorting domain-containing protein [Bacteroidota bacterium]
MGQSKTSITGDLVSGYQQAANTSYSAEWVIGEVITETFKSGSSILSSRLTESAYIVTSVSDGPESVHVRAFPNPFVTMLTVEAPGVDFTKSVVEFYDSQGRQVNVGLTDTQKYQITFSTEVLPSGVYVLRVKHHQKSIQIKVIRK